MIEIIALVVMILIDQGTKYLAITKLKPIGRYPLIDGVFELSYVENKGAAFGIMKGFRWGFLIITVLFLIILYSYYKEVESGFIKFLLILIAAGAIGNAIDRAFRGYVVDFLYFSLIDFPVFNVADMYLVVGVILFTIFSLLSLRGGTPDEI